MACRCSKGWWWRWALSGTKRMNKGLDLACNDTPVYHPAGQLPVRITRSESSVQLFWRLHKRGGSARQQCGHYRYCTAHTVRKQSSLWCAICSYDAAAWKSEKLAVMPACEQQFIVNFLVPAGWDRQYCRQVAPDWWSWPADFWNFELDIYIQIDGSSHWCGMHDVPAETVQERDMMFTQVAVSKGARVVRVHAADVCNYAALHAAIAAAASGRKVVLSPAYATTNITWQSHTLCYVEVLQQQLSLCYCYNDWYGNICF